MTGIHPCCPAEKTAKLQGKVCNETQRHSSIIFTNTAIHKKKSHAHKPYILEGKKKNPIHYIIHNKYTTLYYITATKKTSAKAYISSIEKNSSF